MMRAFGNSARMATIASMPFMSGMRRSISVTSGTQAPEALDGLSPVAGLPHERHVLLALEHRGNSFPQELMIVDGENADSLGVGGRCFMALLPCRTDAVSHDRMPRDASAPSIRDSAGTRKSTSVPAPGLLQTSRCAPSFFARSRIPIRPKWPGVPPRRERRARCPVHRRGSGCATPRRRSSARPRHARRAHAETRCASASRPIRKPSSRTIGCSSRQVPCTLTRNSAGCSSANCSPSAASAWAKILRARGRRTQILDPVATLREQLVRAIERLLHQLARGLAGRHTVGRRLKSPDQSLHSLQQRVVQLARDALALGEPRFEAAAHLRGDLAHSHSVRRGQQRHAREGAQRVEPSASGRTPARS